MLVLSRKQHQSIVIDDNIVVTVLSVKGGIVKLGLTAPGDVHIVRAELISRLSPTESPSPPGCGSGSSRTLYAMAEV